MKLKPTNGGSLRPFGTAWFVIEFLKGHGPEGSTRINPSVGSPMTDICFEYKSALHRAHARDAVDKENENRIKNGQTAFSEPEYAARFKHYLQSIPFKSLKMRYSSFTRYFGHLKRLGWMEPTGRTEPSAIQENYPPAPPRVFYRLTEAGKTASQAQIADPLMALYGYPRKQRSARKPSLIF